MLAPTTNDQQTYSPEEKRPDANDANLRFPTNHLQKKPGDLSEDVNFQNI